MEWVLWSIVVLVLGLAAVAGSGRFGSMPPPVRDTPEPFLPAGDLDGDDLRRLQFAVTLRGYSMTQVDALLDRLAWQLDDARGADGPLRTVCDNGFARTHQPRAVAHEIEVSMAAMKPRTGDGPIEVAKESRVIAMRIPAEGGGRLVIEMSAAEAAELLEALKSVVAPA